MANANYIVGILHTAVNHLHIGILTVIISGSLVPPKKTL